MVALMTLMLIVWGSYSLYHLPIDAVPDITNNQVQIITRSPSQSAIDIERLVTYPLEQSMATIPELEEIRSFSRFGLSVITVVFNESTDVYWARQLVSERLQQVQQTIPSELGIPEMAPVSTGLGEIFQYVLKVDEVYKDSFNLMELRSIQDWIVRRQLLGIEGVADVSSFGGKLKQYEVAIQPELLNSLKMTIPEVLQALKENNQNTGGAYIDKAPQAYFIRTEGLIESLEEIENIPIKARSDGNPIFIKDIAKVHFGYANRYGSLTYNDEGESVGAIVMMLKGENSNAVVHRVKERMKEIEKNLPDGVHVEVFLDRSELVNRAIGTVKTNLIEGALIVLIVLVFFLGNLRAGLIVASVIPLAMLFAISMMYLFGVSGNLMSLGAIDFGLVVDGAVIIVEATLHHLGLRKWSGKMSRDEMNKEVYDSASKIRNSAAFGEIIILIVYLPILALVGVEGKMFKPMAQTVSFAILGAFLLSLTYVPMMSALALSRKSHKENRIDRWIHRLQEAYKRRLRRILEIKKWIIAGTLALFTCALLVFLNLGGEFIPSLEEGDFAVETRLLAGSSLKQTTDISVEAAEVLLHAFPDEVKKVIGKIGTSEIPTDPMPLEACDLMVILKDQKEWKQAKSQSELANLMAEKLSVFTGVNFGFQQPIQMRFNELMTGVKQDVAVKIFGHNLDQLSTLARKVGSLTSKVDGIEDLYIEEVSGLPQIVIKPYRSVLARHHLTVTDINLLIETALAGKNAGFVYEGEKQFELTLRLEESKRQSLEDVQSLYLRGKHGNQIPLSELASIEIVESPNQIQRENTQRRIVVGFNVRGRDVESVVEELSALMDQEMDFPAGYYPVFGGQFENLQEARQRLSIAVPVALALILLLLYFTFGDIQHALLIFSSIPLAAIGGVFALYLRGMPFSISAGVGFIALFGVAVLNGIVLIAEYQHRLKLNSQSLLDLILDGSSTRIRPVLMTACVASLGFLPMALSTSAGAEVQRPLATVVIGGLISSTLLTLFVLPSLYQWLHTMRKKKTLKALVLLPLLAFSINGQAQELNIDQAIQILNDSNGQLQAGKLRVEALEAQIGIRNAMPATLVSTQYGQYNSYISTDNQFQVSQAIPFPSKITAGMASDKANWEAESLNFQVQKRKMEWQLRDAFSRALNQLELIELYQFADSLSKSLMNSGEVRLEEGAISKLELQRIKIKDENLKLKRFQLENEYKSTYALIKSMLGIQDTIIPQSSILNIQLDDTEKTSPTIAWKEAMVKTAMREKREARMGFLPDIELAYINQTLIGNPIEGGLNPMLATPANRFQVFQAGLRIPLFFGSVRRNVKSKELELEARKWELQQEKTNWETEFTLLKSQINLLREMVSPYEEDTEKLISETKESLKAQLSIGSINLNNYLLSLYELIQYQEDLNSLQLNYQLKLNYYQFLKP